MGSSLMGKVLAFMGIEEDELDEDAIEPKAGRRKRSKDRTAKTEGSVQDGLHMIVLEPEQFDDVQEIGDYLKKGQPVIVRLQPVASPLGQRILDFVSGVVYAVDGNMHKISESIVVVTPAGVTVEAAVAQELQEGGLLA